MGTVDAGRFDVEILPFLSERIRTILHNRITVDVEEIRLRAGKPLVMQDSQGEWFFDRSGKVRRLDGKVGNCSGRVSGFDCKIDGCSGKGSGCDGKGDGCSGEVSSCAGKGGYCEGEIDDCAVKAGKVNGCTMKAGIGIGNVNDWTSKGRRVDGNASDWDCKARRWKDIAEAGIRARTEVGTGVGTGVRATTESEARGGTGVRAVAEGVAEFDGLVIVEPTDVAQTLELITSNSVYAFQEEIRNGYITIKGGHRVGIAGKIVSEGFYVKSIKDIMSLNIRVSKEVKGCADKIIPYLIKGENDLYNTLIVSPPQCGKTTMLRDLTRLLSTGCRVNGLSGSTGCDTSGFSGGTGCDANGSLGNTKCGAYRFRGIKVCVVDERSEIAACYKGVPQNDVGVRTDILDSCPKIAGMLMGLRALSPVVIVTDEIGNEGDKDAITRVLNAGVKILTTAHGYSISELKARKEVMELIEEKVFERYVVLSSREGPGTVEEIIEGENFKNIYKGKK